MTPSNRSHERQNSQPPGREPSRTPRSPSARSPSHDRQSFESERSSRRARSYSPQRNSRHRDGDRRPSRDRGDRRSRSRSVSSRRERARGRTRSRSFTGSRSLSRTPSSRSESPLIRSAKIVVERLTKNIRENSLSDIFGHYGEIEDIELPINRQFGHNRGSAYIVYYREADARNAIKHMHESRIDGAIISVSSVAPRSRAEPTPPPAARRSIYTDPYGPPTRSRYGPPTGGYNRLAANAGRSTRHERDIDGDAPRRPSAVPGAASASGRYGTRSDTYRPRAISRSPSASRSPSRPSNSEHNGERRYRYRSRSESSRSRSRTSPRRNARRPPANDKQMDGRHRPHVSSDSYSDRSHSRSRGRTRSRSRSRGDEWNRRRGPQREQEL